MRDATVGTAWPSIQERRHTVGFSCVSPDTQLQAIAPATPHLRVILLGNVCEITRSMPIVRACGVSRCVEIRPKEQEVQRAG